MALNREPTIIINGLSELIRQILPLLLILGVIHLTDEKMGALISIISLTLAFVSTTLLRSQVSPSQDVTTALNMPKGSTEADLQKEISKQ